MKEISFETIYKLVEQEEKKENEVVIVSAGMLNGKSIDFEVKKKISRQDFYNIQATLGVNPFVDIGNGGVAFVPFGSIMAFRFSVITTFTNLPLPTDLNEAENIITQLDAFKKIDETLSDSQQYQDLKAIAKQIQLYNLLKQVVGNNDFNVSGVVEDLRKMNPELLELMTEQISSSNE